MKLADDTPTWLLHLQEKNPRAWKDFKEWLKDHWPFWQDKGECGDDTIWFCLCPIDMQIGYFIKYFYHAPGIKARELDTQTWDVLKHPNSVITWFMQKRERYLRREEKK